MTLFRINAIRREKSIATALKMINLKNIIYLHFCSSLLILTGIEMQVLTAFSMRSLNETTK